MWSTRLRISETWHTWKPGQGWQIPRTGGDGGGPVLRGYRTIVNNVDFDGCRRNRTLKLKRDEERPDAPITHPHV